jgi:Ca2+-binding EF-hand superfamily protein
MMFGSNTRKELWEEFIRVIDADGDGSINREEFRNIFRDLFHLDDAL